MMLIIVVFFTLQTPFIPSNTLTAPWMLFTTKEDIAGLVSSLSVDVSKSIAARDSSLTIIMTLAN